MLTISAFTTIQWKSMVRLFDMHSPPTFNVNRRCQNLLVLQCLQSPARPRRTPRSFRCRTATAPSATSELARGTKSSKNPHTELPGRSPRGETECFPRNTKNFQPGQYVARSMPMYDTRRKANVRTQKCLKFMQILAQREAMWKKFATTTLHWSLLVAKDGLHQSTDGVPLPQRSAHPWTLPSAA